ncbi:MAG TPA: GAF domain-containing protein [Capsulimonadaceae bacterium]
MDKFADSCQPGALDCSAGIVAALQSTSGVAVVLLDLEKRIVSWNVGASNHYGYPAEDVLGREFSFLWHPDEIDEFNSAFDGVLTGTPLAPVEQRFVHASGLIRKMRVFAELVKDNAGAPSRFLVIARDVTDEVIAIEELNQLSAAEYSRSVVLGTASQVALDILASRMGVEALRHIADAARTLAGARYAALGVARPDGNGLLEFVTVGLTPDEEAVIGSRPRGIGVLGLLLNRTEPLRIDDLSKHPASSGFPANHPPMKSFLGVPIRRGDQILGSLYLTDKIGSLAFSDADEDAVQALGAHAAVAIHNLQMLSRQKALVSGLIMAQEEERRAIAYDLHDGLTQFVMASHAHLETFRRAFDAGDNEKAMRQMDTGLRYLKEAVIESRRLVNGLRSLALDDLGLAGALEQLVTEEKNRAEWNDADLIHNIAGRRFDKALETAVYRVAQEAITNARKHAHATRVRVVLLLGPDAQRVGEQLTLEVRDWGAGFIPEQKIGEYNHLGLHGMIERVNLMGGAYDLESRVDEGTRVRATFPVMEPRKTGPIASMGEDDE